MVLEVDVDLYQYFGLSIDSSLREIKKAYKIKAKELHPDKNKDDPKANENFQKLKEYHDILLDPVLKQEYDKKFRAKQAAAKRHSELNDERRRLKEELESREKEAAARRKEAQKMTEKGRIAERIRKEWEEEHEALRYEELQRQRMVNMTESNFIVTVKWGKTHGAHIYTKDFLCTCLQEFGNVLNVVVGKKCSAVAEFATRREAEDAINAGSVGTVGYPDNPLKISWPGGVLPPNTDPIPNVSHSKRKGPPPSKEFQDNLIPENMSFESFEADILAKMARFEILTVWPQFVLPAFRAAALAFAMMDQRVMTDTGGRSRVILAKSNTHSDLLKFKEAKQELQKIFAEIETYTNDCHQFFKHKLSKEAGKRLSPALEKLSSTDLEPHFEKVRQIQQIISRNQMKCAFFGRTSNGKSTVINAMLGSRILPSGIGHTTSCFVQVQGTNQEQGYLQQEPISESENNGTLSEPQPIESVSQLAHSLSSAKLASDALIYLFWPSSSCNLLKEDVVFLDSPGVNVDPDMDAWIDRHCLDADVFILVANAESTLMQAEKDFFYRVSSRISKPNIFILNNRWDASAGEAELADQVREQHMQRCVAFLTEELKVCGREEAVERVFFISAREVLTIRAKALNGGTPPGAAPSIGTPSSGGYPLADGWQARLLEFSTFEGVFEKILSDSATRTKFASHTEQGKEIAAYFRQLMEATYEAALEEKDAGIRYRRLSQARLEKLNEKLHQASMDIDKLITKCLLEVEAQVASALCNEIRRLGELVDSFTGHPFAADNEKVMSAYRAELNAFIGREMGKKLAEACAGDIHSHVVRAEQIMASIYNALLEADEAAKSRIAKHVLASSFEPEFHVDCRNICAEFREDLRFRFSLGLTSLAERLMHRRSVSSILTGGYSNAQGMPEYSPVLPVVLSTIPALLSRNTVGLLVVGGIVLKTTGWRMIMIMGGLYAGLYAYERLSWTNKAREAAFKSQYVEYASQKLRLIVDLTGTNARHQVKRELHQMQKHLADEGRAASDLLTEELAQLDKDLVTLDNITTSAKTLKNGAVYLDGSLDKFHKEYISSAWN